MAALQNMLEGSDIRYESTPLSPRAVRPLWLVPALAFAMACSASYPVAPTGPAVLTGLEVRPPSVSSTFRVGNTFAYTAVAIDSDGVFTNVTAQARWLSADPVVARVIDGSPQFRAIEPGTTDIYAEYRGFTAKAAVTVRP